MSKLLKNTSIYAFGNVLPQAAGFILLPIYTKYLTPSDYGIVTSMQVFSSILSIFFTLAMERAVFRLYFDFNSEVEKRKYLGSILIALITVSVVILILVFIFKNYVNLVFKSIEFYPFYSFTIFSAFITVYSLIPKAYYQITEQALKFVSISVTQFLINSGLVLMFIIYYKEGALGMIKGQLIGSVFLFPIFIALNIKIIIFDFNFEVIKESLKFSVPMLPSLLSAWVMNMFDRIFIERYYTLADVGLYSLSYKISSLMLIITSAFFMAYNPTFYKLANSKDKNEAKNKITQYNNKVILTILIFGFLIVFFAKEVIYLFFDHRYMKAYEVIPLLVSGLVFSQISGLVILSIYQVKRTKQVMYMIISSSILSLVLNYLFIPFYGVFGAAFAALVTYIYQFTINYNYSKKCFFIPILWKKTLPTFSVLVMILLISSQLNTPILFSLLVKILFLTIIIIGALYSRYRGFGSLSNYIKGYFT